jgi:hypothetical protein
VRFFCIVAAKTIMDAKMNTKAILAKIVANPIS